MAHIKEKTNSLMVGSYSNLPGRGIIVSESIVGGAGPINVRREERSKLHLSCGEVRAVCVRVRVCQPQVSFLFFFFSLIAAQLSAAAGLGLLFFFFVIIITGLMRTGALAVMKRHN